MKALARYLVGAVLFLNGAGGSAEPPAFPGAEGYGRFASGGRGGSVYKVTNLNDSGPGSLRAGVEATGPRTIVFRVSGTIYLEDTLDVNNGALTIAGQTAPGDGICIARRGLRVNADNVIVRFIRVRLGDLYPRDNGLLTFESDAFECRYTDKVIIDHCSFSWSIDECATAYSNTNFTMQWCMVSESLLASFHPKGNHGYGGIWGGTHASFHHNMLAHHTSRNPRFNGARYDDPVTWDREVDHRDNVIYNWAGNSCYGGEPNAGGFQANYNLVGNYYKAGPATRSNRDRIIEVTNLDGKVSKFFVEGNYVWGEPAATQDNWLGVDKVPVGEAGAVKSEHGFAMAPMTEQSVLESFELVLEGVGASFPKRDSVDARIVEEVRMGTATYGDNGIINSQDEVGGYPDLASLPAPLDSDRDGMPDSWELAQGLDPRSPEDGRQIDSAQGYSNLERYLNGLVSRLYPKPEFLVVSESDSLKVAWKNQLNRSSLLVSDDLAEWEEEQAIGSAGQAALPPLEVRGKSFFKIDAAGD